MKITGADHWRSGSTHYRLLRGLLVVLLLAIVAWVFVPRFLRAHTGPSRVSCVANLLQLKGAKEQWALEKRKTKGDPVDVIEVCSYLKNHEMPTCPQQGTYTLNPVGANPACSLALTRGHAIQE